MEPKGSKDQFTDYKCIQRGDYRSEDLKTMGIERENEEAFFERTSDMYRSAGKAAKLNAVYIPTILLFGSVAAAFVLYRGGYMVQQDLIKLGTLSVFISYAVVIFEPIQQNSRNVDSI